MKQSDCRSTYLPQPEQEQSEPQLPVKKYCQLYPEMGGVTKQVAGYCFLHVCVSREDLQLEAPEHPQSPFILMVGLVGWKRSEKTLV